MAQGDWVNFQTTSYGGFWPFLYPVNIKITDQQLSFDQAGGDGYQCAMINRVATTNRMRVGATVRNPTAVMAWVGICAKYDWSQSVQIGIRSTGVEIHTSTGFATTTPRAVLSTAIVSGDTVWLQYNEDDGTFYVFLNDDASPILFWTDAGSVIAHGADYSRGMVRLQRSGATVSASLKPVYLQDAPALVIGDPDGFPYTFPIEFPQPPNAVLAPQPLLGMSAPVPLVREVVAAPLAVLNLSAPTPSLPGDPVTAPQPRLQLTAPTPLVREVVAAPLAVLNLSAPTPSIPNKANYSYNFNGTDSNSSTAFNPPFTNQQAGRYLRRLSNAAVPDQINGYALITYQSAMLTVDHKVTVKPLSGGGNFDIIVIYIRGNNTDQVQAWIQNGGPWRIYTRTAAYSNDPTNGITQRATAGNFSWAAADDISFEASGNSYVIRQNGTSKTPWTDTGGAIWGSKVDLSHLDVSVGYYAQAGPAGHGFDDFAAVDL